MKFKTMFLEEQKKLPPIEVRHSRNLDNKSLELLLDEFDLEIGGKKLLEKAKIKFPYGRKIGLIGRNGIGKTCLMNFLV